MLDQRKMEPAVGTSAQGVRKISVAGDRRCFGRGQRKLTASKASSKVLGCSFCCRHAAYHCLVSSFLSPPWHMSRQGRTDLSRKTRLFHDDRGPMNPQGTKRPAASIPPNIRGVSKTSLSIGEFMSSIEFKICNVSKFLLSRRSR